MKHYFKSIKKAKKANESASWAETSQKLLSVNCHKHENLVYQRINSTL